MSEKDCRRAYCKVNAAKYSTYMAEWGPRHQVPKCWNCLPYNTARTMASTTPSRVPHAPLLFHAGQKTSARRTQDHPAILPKLQSKQPPMQKTLTPLHTSMQQQLRAAPCVFTCNPAQCVCHL
jgi:hypothetical protein